MRRPVNPIGADQLLHEIWDSLPEYASCYMEPTFTDHDPEAAADLASAAPNEWRGLIALCAYWIGLPNPAYRAIIDRVWVHDHHYFIAAARGGAPQVRRMFTAAEFPVPFSAAVTVYRGSAAVKPEKALKGLAWTTSHDVACWFAHRFSHEKPLVLKATVPATEIIYWSDERSESEVILRRVPPLAIDEQANRWRGIAENLIQIRQAAVLAKLKHISAGSETG
jgi:hypothetical protein